MRSLDTHPVDSTRRQILRVLLGLGPVVTMGFVVSAAGAWPRVGVVAPQTAVSVGLAALTAWSLLPIGLPAVILQRAISRYQPPGSRLRRVVGLVPWLLSSESGVRAEAVAWLVGYGTAVALFLFALPTGTA